MFGKLQIVSGGETWNRKERYLVWLHPFFCIARLLHTIEYSLCKCFAYNRIFALQMFCIK